MDVTNLGIDFREDPEVPDGREVMDHLVGAHMVAVDEDELLHLVRHALEPITTADASKGRRVATHAAYRGQALIVRLLDLATRQQIQLDGGEIQSRDADELSDRYLKMRLDLWLRVRDA